MNDEYREGTSESGWSSRIAGANTATAEPVDRRWFEEALRAQGFLVEPPPVDVADAPIEVAPVERGLLPKDDLELAEAEAVRESAPLNVAAEPYADPWGRAPEAPAWAAQPEVATNDLSFAEATTGNERFDATVEVPAAPWDLPPSTASWPAVEPAPPTSSSVSWPIIGSRPGVVVPAAVVASEPQPVVPAVRQAVPPASLPPDVPPVPTAALAARLSRSGRSATTAAAAPEPSAETAAPAIDAPSTVPAVTGAADPWTWSAPWADLDTERLDAAEAPVVASITSTPAAPAAPMTLDASDVAVAEPVAATPIAIAVEPTAAERTDTGVMEAAVAAAIVASPEEPVAPPEDSAAASPSGEPAIAPVLATVMPVQPAQASSPPTAGIAAVTPRPTTQTVGTTVDDGESELWGLVGDPAKPASAASAAPAARSPSKTTALLTVFVAIVVVALVLGFIYLFTSLL